MADYNKKKSMTNHKKTDGTFRKKKVKHDPAEESARAVFGKQETPPE